MGIEKRSNKRKNEKTNEEIKIRFEPIIKKIILDNIQKEFKKNEEKK